MQLTCGFRSRFDHGLRRACGLRRRFRRPAGWPRERESFSAIADSAARSTAIFTELGKVLTIRVV